MRQVYLKPRGALGAPPRSDTLFGLITIGIREVLGRESVERFLAPLHRDPPVSPLRLTSAFPYVDGRDGRIHFFPSLCEGGTDGWIEDRELLALASGRPAPEDPTRFSEASGYFFLAEGGGEHYLEAALGYLERSGFGGNASRGGGAYDVEMIDAEFLRTAQAGETGLLLSLFHPTPNERRAIVESAERGERVGYELCRRQGVVDRTRYPSDRPRKRGVTMMREGAILPVASACPGSAPVVATASDAGGSFDVVQNGFGFFVPLAGEKS